MKKYFYLFLFIVFVGLLISALVFYNQMQQAKAERDRYMHNQTTLLTDIETYRVRDSLNAAKVQSLELSVKEYKRFRAEDAALIKDLQVRNRDLSAINKAQSQTIINLRTMARDTIIIRDSVKIPAVSVHCGDKWFDFNGVLAEGEFSGTLCNRDSLMLVETVEYARFLWWKCKKRIKNRQLNVVSKNPHTTIVGLEHVIIAE